MALLDPGFLIPYLIEVVVFFHYGGDAVALTEGVGGEMTAIFREEVRLQRNRESQDIWILLKHQARIGQQRIRLKVILHKNLHVGSDLLDMIHDGGDVAHGLVEGFGGFLYSSLLCLFLGIVEEDTQ